MARVCINPRVRGSGGMASFRLKFEDGLQARGIQVTHDLDQNSDAILLIAGSRQLLSLWKARRRGVRLVQRLDGLNWVHRVRWSGFRYHLRGEYGNAMMAFLRARLADRVIYQSEFVRNWWQAWHGEASAPGRVILNGVDLKIYSPDGRSTAAASDRRYRILLIEGSLAGGLNTGLFHVSQLAEMLAPRFPVEIVVAGQVDNRTRHRIQKATSVPVEFLGVIERSRIPELARSASLLYSAEINPPCPNSVIEALACGLPVLGFDTGSLGELVTGEAGRIVPYGGDPWKLDQPDIPALASAAAEILQDQGRFKTAARARAESAFGLNKMVDEYIKVLLE